MPLPDFIEERPEVPPGLVFFYCAFIELSTDRPVGLSVGAIPWSSMDRYARRYSVRDFGRFERTLRAMDDAFLKARAKK